MRSFLTYIILLLTLILVNSCRKQKNPLFDGVNCSGNCFILTGKLLDSASNAGIASGEIKFFFRDNTGTFSNKKIFLGRTITGTNGNYTFKFEGSRFNNIRGYYYAEAYKGNFFSEPYYQNRVGVFNLDTSFYDIPFTQNFPLFRPATIKVRVIVSNVTNFQYLTVSYSYGKAGTGIVLNGGRRIDTTITWKTAGDIRTFIQGAAAGNGINIVKRDTVIIPENKIGQIEIRF